MSKDNIYPIYIPPGCGYPQLVPVPSTPAKQSAWREWGKSPKPGVIRIGLPKADEVTPSVPPLWKHRPPSNDGQIIQNGRTAWMLDQLLVKEEGKQ